MVKHEYKGKVWRSSDSLVVTVPRHIRDEGKYKEGDRVVVEIRMDRGK